MIFSYYLLIFNDHKKAERQLKLNLAHLDKILDNDDLTEFHSLYGKCVALAIIFYLASSSMPKTKEKNFVFRLPEESLTYDKQQMSK